MSYYSASYFDFDNIRYVEQLQSPLYSWAPWKTQTSLMTGAMLYWLLEPSAPTTTSSIYCISSVQFRHSVMSDSLWPHGLQHARHPVHCQLPEFTYTHVHGVSDAIQPSHAVIPFSSCFQSFPASRSFQKSQFFTWGGQSIGVPASASVSSNEYSTLISLGWTGWISLQSKGFSRVFSNTTVQKHQFIGTQLLLWSNSHIHTWLLEKP